MNKIMSKIILNSAMCFVFVSLFVQVAHIQAVNQKNAEIILENALIGVIDGKPFGINANTYGLILQSRREVRKRLIGVVAEKSKTGFYDFEGRKYYLSELIALEKELAGKQDASSIERNASLKKLLFWAKEDFATFTSEYIDSTKGIKSALLGIMKEFHAKSGLGEFFLLGWVTVPDGGEMDSMRTNVKSFSDLKILFEEMEGFLEAMARSCKKGKKLFIEMVNAAKQANNK